MPVPEQPEMPADAPIRFQPPTIVEASTFADWTDVSRVMAPLFATEGTIGPGTPLAAEVARIAAASRDPLRRIAAALALVQGRIRYQAIAMNGGNYVPQTPAFTWQARYGDCKAKTVLLLAMLRALGIEAEPVLASSTLGGLVNERLPAPGVFDHIIVRATVGSESLWLDGTGAGTRIEDLRDTPPFVTVLPLRPAGAGLMPLPMRPAARPLVRVDATFDDRAGISLPSIVDATLTLRGPGAEAIRMAKAQAAAKQQHEMVLSTMMPLFGPIQLATASLLYDDASGTAQVKARGLVTTSWRRQDRRYERLLSRDTQEFAPDRARLAWQSVPVQMPGPSSISVNLKVLLPEQGAGFVIDPGAAPPSTMPGLAITRRTSLPGPVATMEQRTEQLGTEIAPADLPMVRTALAQMKARPARVLAPADFPTRFEQVRRARSNGTFAALEKTLEEAIAQRPDDATGYSTRAALRQGSYDYRGALLDYDKAIALAPSAELHLRRAIAHEQVGDAAKAMADVAAADRISPDSDEVVAMTIRLRADTGNIDQALALVEPKIQQGGRGQARWLSLKSEVLSRRDPAAAITLLDSAIAEKPGDPMLLNSRCWIKGTHNMALESALQDCTKSIELSDNPAPALDSRAMVYFRMKKLDESLADLSAATEQAPDLAASLYMRGIVLRQLGKTQEGDEALANARMVRPPIDRDYAEYGIKP